MARTIYLDNAATTRLDPRVLDAMTPALSSLYGNPSSLHALGRASRKAVEAAREEVAARLGCEPREVTFTGGGTEADNLALLGAVRGASARGRHVVTTSIEHSAVLKPCARLEQEGIAVTRLAVDPGGHVSPDAVAEALRPETTIVSVMAVNNEIGTIQPLAEIGAVVRAHGALFHVDAVQAAGKIPVRPRDWQADFVSLSGHKFHGPKGVGVLFVREGAPLAPLALGGEHEFQRRPGTENTAGILGFAAALKWADQEREAVGARVRELRDRLEAGLRDRCEQIVVNGAEPRVPHILNVSFRGVEGEAILLSLDARGVCVSTGSACSAHSAEPSHVLRALGRSRELAQGSIRFSLSRETTGEEIDAALTAVLESVERLRTLSPMYESGG